MKLTRQQRGTLQLYKKYKDKKPSILSLLASNSLLFLCEFISIAFIICIPYFLGESIAIIIIVAVVFFAIFTGFILAKVGRAGAFCRTWPVIKNVIDWDKLDTFLQDKNKL